MSMTEDQVQELMTRVAAKLDEINTRDAARPDPLDTEAVNRMIAEAINNLSDNEEFLRKFRPGKRDVPASLIGTKFARYHLTVADIEAISANAAVMYLSEVESSLRRLIVITETRNP